MFGNSKAFEWYVYIISDGFHCYKGLTNNLTNRLKNHKCKKVKGTHLFKDIFLIHVELCPTRSEARRVEKFFKSGYGREILNELLNEMAYLPAGRQARRF